MAGFWLISIFLMGPFLMQSEVKEIKFVASKKSGVFHMSSCKWAKMISEKNRIEFSSREKTDEAGYKACKVCWL